MPGDSGNGTVVENHNNQLNASNGPLGGLERAASMDAKSAEVAKRSPRSRALLGTIQRQASLPAAPNSPVLGNSSTNSHSRLNPSNNDKLLSSKLKKNPLVRMNSDSDLHIQPMSSEEERVLDTLDEIDLLHNIAKTPNLLKVNAEAAAANNSAAAGNKAAATAAAKKKLLVKQKSLNRTLSTSVLRIKKKRCAFWDT